MMAARPVSSRLYQLCVRGFLVIIPVLLFMGLTSNGYAGISQNDAAVVNSKLSAARNTVISGTIGTTTAQPRGTVVPKPQVVIKAVHPLSGVSDIGSKVPIQVKLGEIVRVPSNGLGKGNTTSNRTSLHFVSYPPPPTGTPTMVAKFVTRIPTTATASDLSRQAALSSGGALQPTKAIPGKIRPLAANSTPTIYVTNVDGRFFYPPGGTQTAVVIVTTQTPPAFTQRFPLINFNPPQSYACASATVYSFTHPLTDADESNPCALIPAQATAPAPTPTLLQAGVGPLVGYQAVFLTNLYVSQAADVTFHVQSDDSFIWGIGPRIGDPSAQPTRVSGLFTPGPPPPPTPYPTTPFGNYAVVAQHNDDTYGGEGDVTVHFPEEGFYPIEIDNAENGLGLLDITLEVPAYTPVPKAPAYPWGCTISLTPSPAPSAPNDLVSYYVEPTYTPGPLSTATPIGDLGYWYHRGVAQADQMIQHGGPPVGLSILDFGEPSVTYAGPIPIWGARYIHPDSGFISLGEIKQLAGDYAAGFYDEASQANSPPHLILAIGTSNYWDNKYPLGAIDYGTHGHQWGLAVKHLNQDYIKYSPLVKFEGANDIEFSWSDADRALRWAQGFEEETRPVCPIFCNRNYYYVYGSCNGCYDVTHVTNPDITQVGDGWSIEEAIGAVFANAAAIPIPEIYYDETIPGFANQPRQWQWLSSYANTHVIDLPQYGIPRGVYAPMQIYGPTASGSGGTCCLSPSEAWTKLWQDLNESTCSSVDWMLHIDTIDYRPYRP